MAEAVSRDRTPDQRHVGTKAKVKSKKAKVPREKFTRTYFLLLPFTFLLVSTA
jgi:hypothetical protein